MEFDKEQLAPDNGDAVSGVVVKAFPECDWGAIAMWAWGQSRLMDYLFTTGWADANKIIATGHSCGGKVASRCALPRREPLRWGSMSQKPELPFATPRCVLELASPQSIRT